jgi:hypothetical protein
VVWWVVLFSTTVEVPAHDHNEANGSFLTDNWLKGKAYTGD